MEQKELVDLHGQTEKKGDQELLMVATPPVKTGQIFHFCFSEKTQEVSDSSACKEQAYSSCHHNWRGVIHFSVYPGL